jgi:hypothetical protein
MKTPWIEIEDEYTDCFWMNKTIYFHNFHRNLSYMAALDIDSIRALTVIAESGGITRAAKRLNLSPSAE